VNASGIHDVIDGIDILVCGLDVSGTIHAYNRTCERVTGLAREQALGLSWLELFASGQRVEHVQALWTRVRENAPAGPYEALCRNRRNLRWHFSRHPAGGLAVIALWAVGFDVTEEREALVRARELERMGSLTNLVSGLTHELRNPLNGALLQLALADRMLARHASAGTASAAAAVSQAASEIRRISTVLDDFLVFARPQPLHLERAELRELTARAIERSASRASSAGATVILEPGPEIQAEVAAERLVSALAQLITNAIDASAQATDHEVRVRIGTAKNAVGIEVEDRGVGIQAAEAPSIFEPFFTTKHGGTGLGLSIVQRVAAEHGGTISYARHDGVTVFRLELPIIGGLPN